MNPKYQIGDFLYYVNPFIFTIDKILVEFIDINKVEPQMIYYIDHSGAYLLECDLTHDLKEAKIMAENRLNKFIWEKRTEILNSNPEFLAEE